jgi:Protein O-mannosyl-transferase TMEM260-like
MHRDRSRPPLGSSPGWDPVAERQVPPSLGARLAPGFVFVVALALYLRTLLPDMAFDDWGELQTVPHVLGIAHPTGYPTYILSAWLFELLPIGSIAFRANLFAAVGVAVALAAMTSTTMRLGVRPVLAAAVAIATGAIGTIWASAVVAEVNALHLAFIALIIDRSLAWADERRTRDLALGGLLIGLSLGNHLLTAFVAPFFVLFALWAGRRTLIERKRLILVPIATALAGLTVYLYIPIAASLGPPLPYNHPTTFDAFWFLVTGEQFRGQYDGLFTASNLGTLVDALPTLWTMALSRATDVMPLLGLAGLAILVIRRTAFGLACLGALLVGIDVWANYLRLEHYLLVPWLLVGIGTAVALEGAARGLEAVLPRRVDQAAGPAVVVATAAFAVLLIGVNLPTADLSGDRSARTYVDTLFGALPADAAILSFWGPSPPLWHAQLVLGERPDVLVVDDTNIVYEGFGTHEARIDALICSRPVFILPVRDSDLDPIRERHTVTEVLEVKVGALGPTAKFTLPVYRVDPRPGTCGSSTVRHQTPGSATARPALMAAMKAA